MKDFSAGFTAPLDLPRSRGARLIEEFSPKLERRVQFFDHATFAQRIRLEADPTVMSMCERTRRMGTDPDARVVDFWVRRADDEEPVVLETAPPNRLPPPGRRSGTAHDQPLPAAMRTAVTRAYLMS
jgi:hypothetical protein